MLQMKKSSALLAAATLALGLTAGFADGQAQVPTKTVGQSEEALKSMNLADEMDGVQGRPLRMRKLTLAPGGVLGLHNHVGRPAVGYFLQGEVTYHVEGKPDTVLKPGDSFAEGKATTHWAENRGTVPAVWIAVDIPTKP